MKLNFKPKTNLEKFGEKIYLLLVDNFPQTFFVGGVVRDLLLEKKVIDVDIATSATPSMVTNLLNKHHINFNDQNKKFGSVVAKQGNLEVEITTFRKDLKGHDRYHQVAFVKSAIKDSKRRDFTINSLYLKPKSNKILDYHKGLKDLNGNLIRFIGSPTQRVKQDPLRIIRALRFALVLNFKLETKTKNAIAKNFFLVKSLTKSKLEKEINKVKDRKNKIILQSILNEPKLLDKYFN